MKYKGGLIRGSLFFLFAHKNKRDFLVSNPPDSLSLTKRVSEPQTF